MLGSSANAAGFLILCPGQANPEEAPASNAPQGHRVRDTLELADGEIVYGLPLPGGCDIIYASWQLNVAAALAFFLVAKLLRVLQCLL